MKKPRIFISHASADKNFVESELVDPLAANGIDVWYDKRDIASAEAFDEEIIKALEACDWFLVVLSPDAAESEWVKNETDWAFKNNRRRIIPIMYSECDPSGISLTLQRIQWIDFRTDPKQGREQLFSTFFSWLIDPTLHFKSIERRLETAERGLARHNAFAACALVALILVALFSWTPLRKASQHIGPNGEIYARQIELRDPDFPQSNAMLRPYSLYFESFGTRNVELYTDLRQRMESSDKPESERAYDKVGLQFRHGKEEIGRVLGYDSDGSVRNDFLTR